MFTPKAVHSISETLTLVSGVDEKERAVNAPLIDDAELAAKIAATPRTIPNPDFQALEQEAFAKAAALVVEQEKLLGNEEPPRS